MCDAVGHPRRFFQRLRRWAQSCGNCVACLSVVCLFGGCHNWQKSHETAIANFGHGDIQVSRAAIKESQDKSRTEKKFLELDAGILDLASGNVTKAESRFRSLRRELEHLEQKDVTEHATSMMTDSRAIAYSGRDFERRMILNMALLTSVLGDGQDAFAYSLQATEAANSRRTMLADAAKKKVSESSVVVEAADRKSVV